MRFAKNTYARRGVLLLVVLGLLAMFGLVGITFVVLTGHARRSAKVHARVNQYADRPEMDTREAMMQVVRGTNNPASVLGPHSLLEDLYGNESVRGIVLAGDAFRADRLRTTDAAKDPVDQIFTFWVDSAQIGSPYHRVGCVLTMLDGPAAMRSTRIIGCVPDDPNDPAAFQLQVLAFEGVATWTLIDDLNLSDRSSDPRRFVINGTPFSGAGFGDGTGQLALWPNSPANRNPGVAANEDYDAVDYQNMLLAMILPPETNPTDSKPGVCVPIPSLHRAALVRYWMKWWEDQGNTVNTWLDLEPDLQRKIILRPLPCDHFDDVNNNGVYDDGEPCFTGSNSKFNAAWDGRFVDNSPQDGMCDYQWDVDNDGDGVPDSVWVDLGLPVRSTRDGRLYKPLVAILCVDLDGRLNLNAHGCLAQTQNGYYQPPDSQNVSNEITGSGPWSDPLYAQTGTFQPSVALARGVGYGTAEINLAPLLADAGNPSALYQALLQGTSTTNYSRDIYGRYGDAFEGGFPGKAGVDDWLAWNREFEYRAYDASGNPVDPAYWTGLTPNGLRYVNAYGTPPDFNGNSAVGLDLAGRPIFVGMGEAVQDRETVDDPYELNLSRNIGSADVPYTPAELERILRPFDADASGLPDRLKTLAPILIDRRNELTTESWDLPCPSVHVRDLLAAKGVNPTLWPQLLPPELLAGLKMNLNRPLGNGRDDNNDFVVDDPGETGLPEAVSLASRPTPPLSNVRCTGCESTDVDASGTGEADETPRQLQVRYLYVLAMLLVDDAYNDPAWKEEGTNWPDDRARAHFLAQWAVNVVDFRDRDSIMTRFQYDVDPFEADGWNPTDPQHVVWGCERPELLLTETLAWHDRGLKDTDEEKMEGGGNPGTTTTPMPDTDKDFDQVNMPKGALFVELYNPTPPLEPKPGEFYDLSKTRDVQGVELAATTPTAGNPVWRLIIVSGEDWEKDPDHPVEAERPTIDRSVYFVDPTGVNLVDDGKRFYPDPDNPKPIAPILPDRYAVVGPGETEKRSHVGRKDNDTLADRRVRLIPDANPNNASEQVEVQNNGGTADLPTGEIKRPVAVVIEDLNVSEPHKGYKWNMLEITYGVGDDEFNPPIDMPLDYERDIKMFKKTGTTQRAFVVHLQRLANPLADYNDTTNPYLTVDSMPIDLTAFNGSDKDDDKMPDATMPVRFTSHQRGQTTDVVNATVDQMNNLWKLRFRQKTTRPDVPNPETGGPPNHHFDYILQHTLGYMSEAFGVRMTGARDDYYTGNPADPANGGNGPFPWLAWNNRPFVSHLELLLVPAVRSSRLLVEREGIDERTYGFAQEVGNTDPYTFAPGTTSPEDVAFPHLLKFFHSTDPDTAGGSAQLHRLLEFVHVPSRFVGTEIQGNPALFARVANSPFATPMNGISRYRDPGRVNLNTIFSDRVWLGLMNFFPDMTGSTPYWRWSEFLRSRRRGVDMGAAPDVDTMLTIDPQYPTRFENPFRSFAGASRVPTADLKARIGNEVNATLLRRGPLMDNQPLFDYRSGNLFDETSRNPQFRYQGLTRLGNLVTTRSNVHAVWITVGYFEVKPALGGIDPAHPDGYALGQEMGVDTGDMKRHRAFHIIDRSIGVGFQRGVDLNVEDAVLLGRFIE